jgi:superoxide dismutase, Cu-Zn family
MNKHVAVAIALLAAPVAVASGCANQSSNNASTTTSTTSGSSNAQTLTTQLNTSDGKHVADATVDFSNGYATVTVQTVATGILSPGFHGLHIHAVGKCDGDFTSAGDHFQASGHTGQPASGDLPPLLVRSDGSGKLVATSDGFTQDQLKGPEGSSIVLHEGADTGTTAADQRIACGVLSPANATTTSVSASTSTSTVTTTAGTTVPPVTTVIETPAPTSTTPTTTSAAPSTSTSTVTVIQPPSIPPITVPGPPNGG